MILAIDPSGNFKNGKGQTGFFGMMKGNDNVRFYIHGVIRARDFKTKEDYYNDIILHIKSNPVKTLIIEDFILYESSAHSMTNQNLETSELIGAIEQVANERGIEVVRQRANQIKFSLKKPSVLKAIINIHSEEELISSTKTKDGKVLWNLKGERINNHIVDAIRHYAYYINQKRWSL